MHKTKQNKDLLKKIAVAILIIVAMIGISYAVASLVHKNGSVQTSTNVKNGLSAYELAVQQGYTGSLDEWLISLEGKSAYQIAVDNGYSGSEKDWSKTLSAMSKKDKSDISTASFTKNGDLVIVLSDGTKINVGKAVGALTVTLTNGTVLNLGNIKGADGLGITKSEINASGELVLTYSNGDVKNLGKVTGENGANGTNGADGRGIKSLTLSPDGELVVVMSDNSISNLGNIKGEKGDKGLQGEKGADGRGIAKTELVNGELVITYTDGTSDNFNLNLDENQNKFNYYSFGLLGDGTYSVSIRSEFRDSIEVAVVPSEYNGIKVTQIKTRQGFAGSSLKTVILPDTITKITDYAFYGSPNLKTVYLPKNLEAIERNTFLNCSSLENIVIPDGVTKIGYEAFAGCKSLKTINIPASVKTIMHGAFRDTGLTEVNFEDSTLLWTRTEYRFSDWGSTYSKSNEYANFSFDGMTSTEAAKWLDCSGTYDGGIICNEFTRE